MDRINPIFGSNRLKLGIFGTNGRSPTMIGSVIQRGTKAEAEAYLHDVTVTQQDVRVADAWMELQMEHAQLMAPEKMAAFRQRFVEGAGGFPLIGTATYISERLTLLADCGIDGILLTWVDYIDGLERFIAEVLPQLESAGLRAPFTPQAAAQRAGQPLIITTITHRRGLFMNGSSDAPLRPLLTARLRELALQTPSRGEMEQFYHDTMGYVFDARTGRGIAANRALRFVDGPKNGLAYAAYRLDDMQALDGVRARLSAAQVDHSPVACPDLFSDAETFCDPDGNRFIFGVGGADASSGAVADESDRPARLQHFVTASTEPERIVAFFRAVLGFVVSDYVMDDEGGVRTAFLRSSEEHHSFAVFKAPENRLDHHCYETRDWNAMRDWADHFAHYDVPLFWGPGRHGPGNNLFIFARDPDGNSVELSAELEIVPDHRPTKNWVHERKTLNSWGYGMMRS